MPAASGASTFRGFYVNGPAMVYVKGGAHFSGKSIGVLSELGLSIDPIEIQPRFRYRDVRVDDFGPDIPADVMYQLADVQIKMTLIHYDPFVLDRCYGEAMGMFLPDPGLAGFLSPDDYLAGIVTGAGGTIGKGLPVFASGCQLISLNITANPVVAPPPVGAVANTPLTLANTKQPWRFPACYIMEQPHVIPLGTETSKVQLTWRAIPYKPLYKSGALPGQTVGVININGIPHTPRELLSSGAALWYRSLDTSGAVTVFNY